MKANIYAFPYNQGWQYGTVRSEFAYYVPRTLNHTVPYRYHYKKGVPYLLAKIETHRTVLVFLILTRGGVLEELFLN